MKIVEQNGKSITTKEAESLLFKEFRRPLIEIMTDLRKPIAPRFFKYKMAGNKKITYVSWHQLNKLMDYFTPGWEWQITTSFDDKKVCVVGALTIKAQEGDFTRSATGNENSDVDAYGDPYSNAEAQAFRRACAKWGLGLHLWG